MNWNVSLRNDLGLSYFYAAAHFIEYLISVFGTDSFGAGWMIIHCQLDVDKFGRRCMRSDRR